MFINYQGGKVSNYEFLLEEDGVKIVATGYDRVSSGKCETYLERRKKQRQLKRKKKQKLILEAKKYSIWFHFVKGYTDFYFLIRYRRKIVNYKYRNI